MARPLRLEFPGTLNEISKIQTKVVKPLTWFAKRYSDRRKMCYEAHVVGHYSMKEIAEFPGLHCQTISRDILQFEKMLECET